MSLAGSPKTVLLLEGDPKLRESAPQVLNPLGIKVFAPTPGIDPLGQILDTRPDYLWLDGDLADPALLATIRRQPELASTWIILLSSDTSPDHRARAFDLGADEFAVKPYAPEDLPRTLALLDRFELAFWGVRGTLPVPGAATLKYGGNTSCVSLTIGRDRQFVFDAGTGLRILSNRIMATAGGRFDGRIFISHPHWDHFNSLPFFQPLYLPGNRITLHGPAQGERSLRDLIGDQMDGIFFPITVAEFKAEVEYRDVGEGVYRFDGVQVTAKRLHHPGHCLAYRVDHRGHSVAYVTDNELGARAFEEASVQELIAFLKGVDVLIHDCTYFDDEYPKKVNWGHSSVGQAVRLAHEAGARCFYLYHHDPDHSDENVERKLEIAEKMLAGLKSKTRCRIASEGDSIRVDRCDRSFP
jgi:phosphoribosyl 1,2-cyclic phosphodiesterase